MNYLFDSELSTLCQYLRQTLLRLFPLSHPCEDREHSHIAEDTHWVEVLRINLDYYEDWCNRGRFPRVIHIMPRWFWVTLKDPILVHEIVMLEHRRDTCTLLGWMGSRKGIEMGLMFSLKQPSLRRCWCAWRLHYEWPSRSDTACPLSSAFCEFSCLFSLLLHSSELKWSHNGQRPSLKSL